ncbi:MAG: hypothetical protein J0H75_16595, partial [Rhizobiales bacterium]|nr:hypothetical protein [Hyphomicrobiales bacterium]
ALVLRQVFLEEALASPLAALGTLRTRIAPLVPSADLHALAALLADHACKPLRLPRAPHLALEAHTDEVWCVAFARGGHTLATGARNGQLAHGMRFPIKPLMAGFGRPVH